MSVLEREIKNEILKMNYYFSNQNSDYSFKDKAISICEKTFSKISNNFVEILKQISVDLLVELSESALNINEYFTIDIADKILKLYFEMDQSNNINKNNFYVRALLVKAQIEAKNIERKNLKAEEAINCLKISVINIQKAIETIAKPENKVKYGFLVYNASIIAFNIFRNYFKPNWIKNFFEILEKLSQLIEESDDIDFNWRLRFLIKLAQSYIDADKKAEGGKALDKITDLLKKKGVSDFQEELLRYRIHLSRDNNGALGNIKKDADANTQNPSFKFVFTIQCLKSGVIPDNNLDKEVQTVITLLFPDFYKIISSGGNFNTQSIKIDVWRADVLSELAFILLRKTISIINNPNLINTLNTLVFNLYDFLISSRSNSLKGKIFLENLRAQIILLKLETELKVNSIPDNEVRIRRIDTRTESLRILERNLSGSSRTGDFDMINETCMLIFNIATPFFKKSFRSNYFKAFSSAAELLEQINSNESQLRASIHLELGKYYLDDDLLQEADSNIVKSLTLDYSTPINKLSIPYKPNEPNTNVGYLQRNLEQFLIYLKRSISVKTNIYSDPENTIDQIIFEADNIRHSKYDEIKIKSIEKSTKLIKSFTIHEFTPDTINNDLVEEEIADLKIKHDLKIYDDKKHFTNASLEIARLAFEYNQFENLLDICQQMCRFSTEWNYLKDVDQILALGEVNLLAARCYEEFLLKENIELGTIDIINYSSVNENKIYSDSEKDIFKEWKQKSLNHLKEANRYGVIVSQHWFIFNCAVQLWNSFLPIIRAENFIVTCSDAVIPLMTDVFEGLNSAMIYYESIFADVYDTDIFEKIEIFCNLTSAYARLLDARGRSDESIRICDVMLSRKLSSRQRKIFDTIKARAIKSDTSKKAGAKTSTAAAGKNKNNLQLVYTPTPEQILISDCFSILESAIISKDEKTKLENLKKGIDCLKNSKINFLDEACLELNAELWYKYGVQFYSFNTYPNYKLALFCADNCVKTFSNIDLGNKNPNTKDINVNLLAKEISYNLQKWYSVGFLLYGDSSYKLVDKDKQERLSQIKLYFTSIDKLIQSAKIAEKCKQYYVIMQAIKSFYSVTIQVIDQPQSRENLCKRFLELHKILVNNRPGAGILYQEEEFLLLFFSLFCLCINETKNWELGEKVVAEALKIIPTNLHHFLLEHKLFYYSKMGKSFIQNLIDDTNNSNNKKDNQMLSRENNMTGGNPSGSGASSNKDKDLMTKAKLLVKLARSSPNKSDQFNAFTKSIEMLKNDSNILVCDVIFEYSTWLYKNNYPNEDIEDNLLQAADILLEIEPIFDDEEDLEGEEGTSLYSKRSGSSRPSRLSKRSKAISKTKASETKKKSVNETRKTSIKGSRSRNFSNNDSKTKTVFAKLLEYDPYPLFMNISHCDQLFKIHAFLSISSNEERKRQEYLLDAFYFLMKIYEISFKTLNCLEFYDKYKDEIISKSNEINTLQTLINNYYIARDLNIPQVYNLPESLDNWINFSLPSYFIKKIQDENSLSNNLVFSTESTVASSLPNGTLFCKKAFEKPYQLFYYLRYVVDKFMNEYFFHTQCIPILKFCIIYCEYVLENNDLKLVYTMKLKRLYHNFINSNAQMNNLNNELDVSNIPILTSEKKERQREELRKYDINLNINNEESFKVSNLENSSFSSVIIIENLPQHLYWIELAYELYNFGYYQYAKEYLQESIFHCLVLKDKINYVKSNILLARIYYIEAYFDESFSILNMIQNINTDFEMFFEVASIICGMYTFLNKWEELILYTKSLMVYIKSCKENIGNINKILSFTILMNSKAKMKRLSKELKSGDNEVNSGNSANSGTKSNSNINSSNNNNAKGSSNILDYIIQFYKNEIIEQMKLFEEISFTSNMTDFNSLQNITSLIEYVDLTLEIVVKNNKFTYVNSNQLNMIVKEILGKCMNTYLYKSQVYLNRIQTYIPSRIDSNLYSLAVHRLIGIIKIKYAIINNLIGEFKSRIKRESLINDFKTEMDSNIGVRYNQQVIDLLNSLTKEINRMDMEKNSKDNKELEDQNRYEKSISLLSSTESLIPNNTPEFIEYFVEKINSHRLQSVHHKELKTLWDDDLLKSIKENISAITTEESPSPAYKIKYFHQITLNLINELETNLPTILTNLNINLIPFKPLLKYYFNILESSGYLNIELSFKALCDLQNCFTKIYFSEVVNSYLESCSRDWVTNSSFYLSKNNFTLNSFSSNCNYINSISYPESINNYARYISDLPYFKNIFSQPAIFSNWTETKNTLSTNSSYFIFQMNEDRSILYIGFMWLINGTDKKVDYYIKRILMDNSTNLKLDEMIETINKMKHTLIKTVIITKEDMNNIYDSYNEFINSVSSMIESGMIFSSNLSDINNIINPGSDVINNEELNKEVIGKNDKKAPLQTQKKDNTKNATVNSNYPTETILPTSGIESITFLIDYRFYLLPFENLSLFSKIPLKSNDFSMNCLTMRIKSANSNTSNGIKYYYDYSPKISLKYDIKKLTDTKLSQTSSSKKGENTGTGIEGVVSYDHYPSISELQKLFSNSNSFLFSSQTSFLFQLPPFEILDLSKFSKCRSAIILDRISTTKNFVNQKSLIPQHFSFYTQPLDLIALLTITGVNTIVTTKWSLDYDEVSEMIDDILEETSKGFSLSVCLSRYKNPKKEVLQSEPVKEEKLFDKKKNKKEEIPAQNDNKQSNANTNIKMIIKKEIFQYSPVIYGISNGKLN